MLASPLISTAFVMSISFIATARADEPWIKNFGTTATDYAVALASGKPGSVFVAGYTEGRLGQYQYGKWDGFLGRYTVAGDQVWARQIGSDGDDYARQIAPDGAGGVYVAGTTRGDLGGYWFGGADVWVARYDADGNQLWFTRIGSSDDDEAFGVAADGDDGVFVVGDTYGDFGGPPLGEPDSFVARLDSSGVFRWAAHIGTPKFEETRGVASDGAGGVYVGGKTSGTLGEQNFGGSDMYLARFDPAGSPMWAIQLGTESGEALRCLLPDGQGGVILAGDTGGAMGGPSAGSSDVLIARCTPGGQVDWMSQFGTDHGDAAWGLAAAGNGGWFVAGETSGDWAGPNAGIVDGFLILCDPTGHVTWVTQFGTKQQEYRITTASDGLGGAFVLGFTSGDFGGKVGGFDGFLGHFTPPDCYPDMDGSGTLDLFDFLAYVNIFNAQEPAADCDGSEVLDLFDFLCFLNTFNAGC